jgi:cytidylate kinase
MSERDHIVIAIDGPAGAGKSTVARKVANRFSLLYIDSGAMYRAVAWKSLDEGIDLTDAEAVARLAEEMKIELRTASDGTRVFVDDREITGFIRAPEVTDASSRISAIVGVREILVKQQQAMGRETGVVMEGRDIGTVVFPETPFKFYLDASVGERARRRKKDLEEAGFEVELDRLEKEVAERDERDSTRLASPLMKVKDATVIDTTGMTIDEVVEAIAAGVDEVVADLASEDS